jgi:nitronate monooxygenase
LQPDSDSLKQSWPDTRLLDLFGVEIPIIQAPMANATAIDMAVAVAESGALGSYPCAGLTDEKITEGVTTIRTRTKKPLNLNFFCHQVPPADAERDAGWLHRLAPYYRELGADTPSVPFKATIYSFTPATCTIVEQLKPTVVSFHFGLPEAGLVARVKAAGCKIISSATSLDEALWLAEHGVDAIIAQGAEAGGHRGMFLETDVATQIGTFALLQQIVEAVKVPVIAAGGIGDGRSITATFVLGAAGVQIGTAYLGCPEATISALHREALRKEGRETVITNVLSGRPARSIMNRMIREQGPINTTSLPAYPLATPAIAPLRAKAEAKGLTDFSPLWSGQGAPPRQGVGAKELTQALAEEALALLG